MIFSASRYIHEHNIAMSILEITFILIFLSLIDIFMLNLIVLKIYKNDSETDE